MKKIAKIQRVERGFVLTLPEEMFAGLGLGAGDDIVAESTGNTIELSAAAPDFERQMELAEEIMDEYAEALAELAR
jgi:putative addiction module antidote